VAQISGKEVSCVATLPGRGAAPVMGEFTPNSVARVATETIGRYDRGSRCAPKLPDADWSGLREILAQGPTIRPGQISGAHHDHGCTVYFTQGSRSCLLLDTTYGLTDDEALWATLENRAKFQPRKRLARKAPG
jgi:hypothetical protein